MMMSFFTDELAKAKTNKKEFWKKINQLIPWSEGAAKIKPHYYKVRKYKVKGGMRKKQKIRGKLVIRQA